jgi:hypoxanthine phosphoribosyltransferase
MDKIFISAEALLRDSFELGARILESDFNPTFIIGVWRGGAPVGIAVQELLEMCDCPTDHYAIRTSSYGKGTVGAKDIKLYGLRHIVDIVGAHDKLLIVDDVFDSGRSIDAIINELEKLCRRNTPEEIKVATVYYKPTKNKTNRIPDFFIHETDRWLVFPHELHGCSPQELKENKPLPARLLDGKFGLSS